MALSQNHNSIDAFLRVYRESANHILSAIESEEWQKVWLLVKERDRLRRQGGGSLSVLHQEGNLPNDNDPTADVSSLKGLLREVQDIEAKCLSILQRRMETIQVELRGLNDLRRWSRMHLYPTSKQARFVDAEG